MNENYNVFPKLIECRKLLGYTQKDMGRNGWRRT